MPDKRIAAMITVVGELVVLVIAVIWFFLAKIEPGQMGLFTIDLRDSSMIIAVTIPAMIAAFLVSVINLLLLKVQAMRNVVDEVMLPLLGPFTILDSVIVALVSGVSEEFLFRGVLQNQLLHLGQFIDQHRIFYLHDGRDAYPIAVLLSALAFAMAHFKNRRYLPYTFWAFIIGLLMSYLLYRTSSLLTPMLAHALINLTSINVLRTMYRHNPPQLTESL